MNARFSMLPYATQVAVENAANALARAVQVGAAKTKIADRAARRLVAANARADRLIQDMRFMNYPPQW